MLTCVISVLVLLLDDVQAQAVTPGSPFPSDPYCDYFYILKGIEAGANDVDPYPVRCIGLDPTDPDDQNPGTDCRSVWHEIFCPSVCTECDTQGRLWCPPLTAARKTQKPPPLSTTLTEDCLESCQRLENLPGDVTVDSGPYTIDCGDSYQEVSEWCGRGNCGGCEGPLYRNPFCKQIQGRFALDCDPLDPSRFPDTCSHLCGDEAWRKGLTTVVTTPFKVPCEASLPENTGEEKGQWCGRDCSGECHGFCPGGDLYCPAGVVPRDPRITTTKRTTTTGGPTPVELTQSPESKAAAEKQAILGLVIIFGGLFLSCCGCFCNAFFIYKACNRGGRRVGAVGGGLGMLQPQQPLQPPPPIIRGPPINGPARVV